jgi:hypothetical protein
MWEKFIGFLESNQLECLYIKYFGLRCPGCGLQTSVIELLKGNIIESFKAYPPLYSILVMFLYLVLHLMFKFKYGSKVLIYMYIINIFSLIINYIYQLLIN